MIQISRYKEEIVFLNQDFANIAKSSLTIKNQNVYSPKVHPNQLLYLWKRRKQTTKSQLKRIQIHKHMTKTTQCHDLLPNMYTKIRYMTWYTLNKKEKTQSLFAINKKQYKSIHIKEKEHRWFTTYREQRIDTTRSNEKESKESIQIYKGQI